MFTVNDQVITRFNYFDVHRIVANFVVPSHSSAALFIKRLSLSHYVSHNPCTDQRGEKSWDGLQEE